LTAARSEVASLTAENERLRDELDLWKRSHLNQEHEKVNSRAEVERLRKERDEARATKDMHKERQQEAELALSSLRELESAARAWAGKFEPMAGRPLDPDYCSAEEIALVAAVDALPPTPLVGS
jgi:hypothetical protein